ncbi:hypothetical protein IMG5_181400 [Ichthyophthirius multifiliis]|uniref:Uncharacterized protein n=1 Tax=Ichthyophthirius multifiliis TaxID=5932 RepID=G0R2T9_ICHMU|nr:hypothetical protein IMG5_181400 [Ichthyophthirius multifiliis]EGR28211.1 hypothetical protein IMG5_181400 [Ichthyophthirius multifiliis]|eukprot:XP_004027556.1 hypothetical protein IMG5_181400 [Ichthyophthirius multifiliis]
MRSHKTFNSLFQIPLHIIRSSHTNFYLVMGHQSFRIRYQYSQFALDLSKYCLDSKNVVLEIFIIQNVKIISFKRRKSKQKFQIKKIKNQRLLKLKHQLLVEKEMFLGSKLINSILLQKICKISTIEIMLISYKKKDNQNMNQEFNQIMSKNMVLLLKIQFIIL